MSFEKFGINAAILDALKKEGFKKPTPIQSRAVPALLAGSDLLGGAETGTGKTAAFTIPVLDKLSCRKSSGKHPRALILVPTRELAQQVYENVKSYGRYLKLRSVEVYGGVNIQPQIKKLDRGSDIVIATPGRLLDLIGQDVVKLKNIEMLVLDEADRMLDMGFINDIKKILGFIPKDRQTMLFSATFPAEIKKLADRMLVEPEVIELTPKNKAAETVSQAAYPVINEKKLKLLYRLIKDKGWYQVLIFTKTKRRAQSLSLQLAKKGVPSDAIHGDKSQGARTRALKSFKSGKIQALVATDIAARGIDINQLDCVINFQLPQAPEDYIHRIGRTGRAGQTGTAVSLISSEDIDQFRTIEKHLKRKIETVLLDEFVTDSIRKELDKNNKAGRTSGNIRTGSSRTGTGRSRQNSSTAAAGRKGRNNGNNKYSTGADGNSRKSTGPSSEERAVSTYRGQPAGNPRRNSKGSSPSSEERAVSSYKGQSAGNPRRNSKSSSSSPEGRAVTTYRGRSAGNSRTNRKNSRKSA